MAALTVAYAAEGKKSRLLKLSILGRPFVIAYKGCIRLIKETKAKLASARNQTAGAEIYNNILGDIPQVGSGKDKMYADLTPTKVERLLPIDPRLKTSTLKGAELCNHEKKEQGVTVESKLCLGCCLAFPDWPNEVCDPDEHISKELHEHNKLCRRVEANKAKNDAFMRDFRTKELEEEMTFLGFEKNEFFRRDFNIHELDAALTSLGFGGLNEQFKNVGLRLVTPRILPETLSREIRITPPKGLIIHGPPGTGKTLVGGLLSRILDAKLTVVRGPAIIGTLVGSSEKNLRDIFTPSINDYKKMGGKSPVHVIIIEEIDAIAMKRGANSATDRIVSQLASLVDGVSEQTNLLVVGTTSRIEVIDDGLLRPGRFELRLQVDLPNEDARLKILQLRFKRMQRWISFDADIDLSAIASATEGFNRVDVEGLLQQAMRTAMFRCCPSTDNIKAEDIHIMKADIQNALEDFGIDLE